MHRNIILAAAALVYYLIAGVGLYLFESELLVTSIILFGLPAYALARYSAAPAPVIAAVITLGAGIAVLLEGIAHLYGLWQAAGIPQLQLFGLIPLEVICTSIVQTLFLVLLYELIFDDGKYSVSHARVRLTAFAVFSISIVGLVGIHQYLMPSTFLAYPYLWILGILAGSSLAAVAVHKKLGLRFFDKLAAFTVIAAFPLSINLLISAANAHKVFLQPEGYMYSLTLFGNAVPLEEFLLVFLMPLFVATFYELFIDDEK